MRTIHQWVPRILVLCTLVVSASPHVRAASSGEVIPGDVNGDGRVTIDDVGAALRLATGLVAAQDPAALLAADVDPVPGTGPRSGQGWGDGRVTIADAISILRHVNGLAANPWPGYVLPATFTFLQSAIFTPSCATPSCHGGRSQQSGLLLTDGNAYAQLVGKLSEEHSTQMRVDPRHPERSYLIDKLRGATSISGVRMPYGTDGLPSAAIDAVSRWIAAGAPNNGEPIRSLPGSIAAPVGGDSDASLPAPAPGQGFQIVVGPFPVAKGAEVQRNYYIHLPNTEDVDVTTIEIAQNHGSHHCTLFKRDDVDVPDHYEESFDQVAWEDWNLVVNSQISHLDWRLPAGVGIHLKARQQVNLQVHFVNIASQLLVTPLNRGKVVINFYTAQPGTVKWRAGSMFARNTSIVIPPHQEVTFHKVCPVPQDIHIIGVTGHYHSRGLRFVVNTWDPTQGTGTEIYRTEDFADPAFVIYQNPIPLKAGQGIVYTTTYKNDTDRMFTFGPIEETEEHCNLFIVLLSGIAGRPGPQLLLGILTALALWPGPSARAQMGEIGHSPAPPQVIMPTGLTPPVLTISSPGASASSLPFNTPGTLESRDAAGMPTIVVSLPLGFAIPQVELGVAPLSVSQLMMDQAAVRAAAPSLTPVFGFQWGMIKPDGTLSIDPISVTGGPTADVTLPSGSMPPGFPVAYFVSDGALHLMPNVVVSPIPRGSGDPAGPSKIHLAGLTTTGEIEIVVCGDGCGTTGPVLGDIDGDGKVTVADAVRVLRGLVGLITLSKGERMAADLDGTGHLTVRDVTLILKISVGLAG